MTLPLTPHLGATLAVATAVSVVAAACGGGHSGTPSSGGATSTIRASTGGATGSGAGTTGSGGMTADASAAVPPPPGDVADRLGIYAWGFDTTSWPGTPDRLNWAAGQVAALGARTIRVYLGPQDIYQVLPSGGTFTLASAAASPAYAALFGNPAFDTILLTTYSEADDTSDWTGGLTPAQVASERQEIAALGAYLLSTYPGKTFVLLNWEGDNAISSVASSGTAWDGFIAWINARAAGVVDARAMVPGSTAHLRSGVEFNLLRSLSSGAPCDTDANKCVVSVVLPSVSVDYYSYSSWDSLLPNQAPAAVVTQLEDDLTTALGWAQKGDPTATPARFIVGEFGAPREDQDLGECAATSRVAAVLGAIPAWGASYGIFWQIIDNTPPTEANDFVTGFGVYKASGASSLLVPLFHALYTTGTPTLPTFPSCPENNPMGVVNAAFPSMTTISGDTLISIYGTGFTQTGNVVHVRETGHGWDVTAGSPSFYESPTQINLTLPGVGTGQNAFVFESDADGIDTNGQVISIAP